jgi:signal transduction histidine kinase
VSATLQQTLEAEMDEALGAEKSERTPGRLGYRAGYYGRTLVTRVGKIELRVPQDRQGRFRTEVFERYQRSEKALVMAMMEMYLQGVSTRKVKAVTEELCGHEFSSSTVSRVVAKLDEELDKFSRRRLDEDYPYLILDARYEKVREDGAVRSQAVLIAIGIDWEGRRNGRIDAIHGVVNAGAFGKDAEAQLSRSQRMEGRGLLLCQTAHNLNNLLTCILGYAELIELDCAPAAPTAEKLTKIKAAGQRAATLTRHILDFARGSPVCQVQESRHNASLAEREASFLQHRDPDLSSPGISDAKKSGVAPEMSSPQNDFIRLSFPV